MNADRLLEVYEQISEAPDAIVLLRRFVLDLAVRGKLVEQDAGDEPASNLFKKFAGKKADLVKRKMIRKPKALKPISDVEELSYTPLGWETQRLGNISILITKGSTPTSYGHEFTQEGVNFLKVETIRNDRVDASSVTAFISNETHEFMSRSQLEAGDILFSIAGSIGTCAVVSADILPANTNQALAIIRGTATVFNPDFLLLLFRSFVSDAVKDRARGGAMNNVSLTDLQNLVLPIPPLAEQHRIVVKVDELMALCDRLEEARKTREETRDKLTAASLTRLTAPDTTPEEFPAHARFALETLPALTSRPDQIKTLRQTILSLAVRGKLVEQDAADESAEALSLHLDAEKGRLMKAGEIRKQKVAPPLSKDEVPFLAPNGWVWLRLLAVGQTQTGTSPSSSRDELFGDFIPFVKPADLDGSEVNYGGPGLSEAGIEHSRVAKKNSVMMVCIGGTLGKVNTTSQDVCFNQQINSITPFLDGLHRYISIALKSSYFQNLSWANAGVGTLPIISKGKWEILPIPLPPLAEQHRIVAKVDALMALCDRLEAALTTTDTTRTRLLEALLHEALEPASKTLEFAE